MTGWSFEDTIDELLEEEEMQPEWTEDNALAERLSGRRNGVAEMGPANLTAIQLLRN